MHLELKPGAVAMAANYQGRLQAAARVVNDMKESVKREIRLGTIREPAASDLLGEMEDAEKSLVIAMTRCRDLAP